MKETAINLKRVFIYEAQVRTKFEIYARIAQKEGLPPIISTNLIEIADQVKEHAYWIFYTLQQFKKEDFVENVKVEIESFAIYGTTAENLESAIKEGENYGLPLLQNTTNIAEEEGYIEIVNRLEEISQTTKNYLYRLGTLLKLLQEENIFQKNKITIWKCMECGFEVLSEGLEEDFNCPVCGHLKLYFKKESFDITNQKFVLKEKEKPIWICMECGFEVMLDNLPDNWKCPSCKRTKEYFKRKPFKAKEERISASIREKATWICLECGNEEQVDLPHDWRCSVCGYPKKEN